MQAQDAMPHGTEPRRATHGKPECAAVGACAPARRGDRAAEQGEAVQHGLNPRLVTLMVGIGIPCRW